jgi:hypothetical protein
VALLRTSDSLFNVKLLISNRQMKVNKKINSVYPVALLRL